MLDQWVNNINFLPVNQTMQIMRQIWDKSSMSSNINTQMNCFFSSSDLYLIAEKELLVQYTDVGTPSVPHGKAAKWGPGSIDSRTSNHWLIVRYHQCCFKVTLSIYGSSASLCWSPDQVFIFTSPKTVCRPTVWARTLKAHTHTHTDQ